MLITGRNLRCSKCGKQLTTRAEKSRVYVDTDRQGTLKLVCIQCAQRR